MLQTVDIYGQLDIAVANAGTSVQMGPMLEVFCRAKPKGSICLLYK